VGYSEYSQYSAPGRHWRVDARGGASEPSLSPNLYSEYSLGYSEYSLGTQSTHGASASESNLSLKLETSASSRHRPACAAVSAQSTPVLPPAQPRLRTIADSLRPPLQFGYNSATIRPLRMGRCVRQCSKSSCLNSLPLQLTTRLGSFPLRPVPA
jgi:hypothetical protein